MSCQKNQNNLLIRQEDAGFFQFEKKRSQNEKLIVETLGPLQGLHEVFKEGALEKRPLSERTA